MDASKKFISILCVVAIAANAALGYGGMGSGTPQFQQSGRGNQRIDNSTNIAPTFSVSVPAHEMWEIASYDQNIYADFYEENKSSGEYARITVSASGQVANKILGVSATEDGFGNRHSTSCFFEEASGSFTVDIKESGGLPLSFSGQFQSDRAEYTDLYSRGIIQTTVNASISVDHAPYINIPLDYEGNLRSFPDPNAAETDTLEEAIFAKSQVISPESNGSVFSGDPSGEGIANYTWRVDGADQISGYDALRINVTTTIGDDDADFCRLMWVSNSVPWAVQAYTRTNTSWDDRGSMGYLIVEMWRTIKASSGFLEGTEQIPWGDCTGTHFAHSNAQGEYLPWGYIPTSGSTFPQGSFELKPEVAVDVAIANSAGLRGFLDRYDDVTVAGAVYNTSKDPFDIQGKTGEQYWNITFARRAAPEEENRSIRDYNRSYNVLVERSVKRSGLQLQENIFLKEDNGIGREFAPLGRSNLSQTALTLSSCESLFKSDSEINAKAFDQRTGKIDFSDSVFAIGMAGVSAEGAGVNIAEILTGLSIPTSRYSYVLQKDTIYKNGKTFSAAMDIETGRLIYTIEAKGTPLLGLL